jgi:hypothetical protein
MKKNIPLFIFLAVSIVSYSQKTTDFGVLKKPDEQVVFSFRLKSNNKTAVLCRQKNNKYLVYRFGADNKIELQYPAILSAASWKLFKYSGYSRGGGRGSVEEEHIISFISNGTAYKIFDEYASGFNDEGSVGILIKISGKQTKIAGNIHSKTGTLGLLRDYEDLIPNNYWDENQ